RGGGVEFRHARGVSGRRVRESVGGRMLVREMFARRREPDAGVAFVVERLVIAPAAEPVLAEDHVDVHAGNITPAGGADESRELPRRRIARVFGKYEHAPRLAATVAADVVADDVVVE